MKRLLQNTIRNDLIMIVQLFNDLLNAHIFYTENHHHTIISIPVIIVIKLIHCGRSIKFQITHQIFGRMEMQMLCYTLIVCVCDVNAQFSAAVVPIINGLCTSSHWVYFCSRLHECILILTSFFFVVHNDYLYEHWFRRVELEAFFVMVLGVWVKIIDKTFLHKLR